MYNNPYMTPYNNNYGQQSLNDRIDNQIAQLNQMKEQLKNNQQPAINQTFQLAPLNNGQMKFVNTIEDVNKEIVYTDTPFFSKNMSVVWIKNSKGEIKTYELNEIVPRDEKDIKIEFLQAQIEELRKEMKRNEPDDDVNEPVAKPTESKKSSDVSTVSKPKTKSE
ncbi:MAG: hypothetical protein IKV94_02730 [Clostridia bacterium]|nr:hypothetical protein [Clostridia bacterium]MBR6517143.1 hypothetical protein [Bacilli bacterium]